LTNQYIEKRDEVYWVAGTRVSLDSVVYAFRRGASPESIQRSFSLLTLEQVYGAITFYLARQSEIDTYLRHGDEELERTREAAREADPDFYKKLEAARNQLPTKPS
jgi:uncharacterized protein (DUF433 family)